MQFHFHANQSNFRKKGFALRLALKQRHKGIRKWLILNIILLLSILPGSLAKHLAVIYLGL